MWPSEQKLRGLFLWLFMHVSAHARQGEAAGMLGTELTLISTRRTGRLPRHGQLALRAPARPRRRVGTTIERELADTLVAARLDARQGRAVAARLGWDG